VKETGWDGVGDSQSSAKSEIGFRKWTPYPMPSQHSPEIIRPTHLQSSTMPRSVQWWEYVVPTFQKLLSSFQLICCTDLFHVCPLGVNRFDSFLNCSIDNNSILNYLIPWDIDYTQMCTSPITKIKTPWVTTDLISIYRCNDWLKHRVNQSTRKTNWQK